MPLKCPNCKRPVDHVLHEHRSCIEQLGLTLASVENRMRHLSKALAPFARFIEIYDGGESCNGSVLHKDLPDDFVIYQHSSSTGDAVLTLGMFRKAKKMLEAP